MSDHHDLGPCCICEATGETVRNVIMLDKAAPQEGTGWGCVACGLPANGAVAVVCDRCIEANQVVDRLRFAIDGYAGRKQRMPIGELQDLPPDFKHDDAAHADELAWMN